MFSSVNYYASKTDMYPHAKARTEFANFFSAISLCFRYSLALLNWPLHLCFDSTYDLLPKRWHQHTLCLRGPEALCSHVLMATSLTICL
jgi:hypothetical protein